MWHNMVVGSVFDVKGAHQQIYNPSSTKRREVNRFKKNDVGVSFDASCTSNYSDGPFVAVYDVWKGVLMTSSDAASQTAAFILPSVTHTLYVCFTSLTWLYRSDATSYAAAVLATFRYRDKSPFCVLSERLWLTRMSCRWLIRWTTTWPHWRSRSRRRHCRRIHQLDMTTSSARIKNDASGFRTGAGTLFTISFGWQTTDTCYDLWTTYSSIRLVENRQTNTRSKNLTRVCSSSKEYPVCGPLLTKNYNLLQFYTAEKSMAGFSPLKETAFPIPSLYFQSTTTQLQKLILKPPLHPSNFPQSKNQQQQLHRVKKIFIECYPQSSSYSEKRLCHMTVINHSLKLAAVISLVS